MAFLSEHCSTPPLASPPVSAFSGVFPCFWSELAALKRLELKSKTPFKAPQSSCLSFLAQAASKLVNLVQLFLIGTKLRPHTFIENSSMFQPSFFLTEFLLKLMISYGSTGRPKKGFKDLRIFCLLLFVCYLNFDQCFRLDQRSCQLPCTWLTKGRPGPDRHLTKCCQPKLTRSPACPVSPLCPRNQQLRRCCHETS